MKEKDFRQKASETLFVKLSFMSTINTLRQLKSELGWEVSKKMQNQRKFDNNKSIRDERNWYNLYATRNMSRIVK